MKADALRVLAARSSAAAQRVAGHADAVQGLAEQLSSFSRQLVTNASDALSIARLRSQAVAAATLRLAALQQLHNARSGVSHDAFQAEQLLETSTFKDLAGAAGEALTMRSHADAAKRGAAQHLQQVALCQTSLLRAGGEERVAHTGAELVGDQRCRSCGTIVAPSYVHYMGGECLVVSGIAAFRLANACLAAHVLATPALVRHLQAETHMQLGIKIGAVLQDAQHHIRCAVDQRASAVGHDAAATQQLQCSIDHGQQAQAMQTEAAAATAAVSTLQKVGSVWVALAAAAAVCSTALPAWRLPKPTANIHVADACRLLVMMPQAISLPRLRRQWSKRPVALRPMAASALLQPCARKAWHLLQHRLPRCMRLPWPPSSS